MDGGCTSWRAAPEGQDLLWELHAMSRVTDLLLDSEQEYLDLFTPLVARTDAGGICCSTGPASASARVSSMLGKASPTAHRCTGRSGGTPGLALDHPSNLSTEERLLTPGERRELLRHRCLPRSPRQAEALAGSPGWELDLMPFAWRPPR